MKSLIIILLAIIAISTAYVATRKTPPDLAANPAPVIQADNPFATATSPVTEVSRLQQQMQEEIASRAALETQVRQLEQRLARLEPKSAPAETTPPGKAPANTDTGENSGKPWFNTQALIEAGFDTTLAEQLQQRYEDVELARLYLRDEARRDGWIGSERFREEMIKLEDRITGLRSEYNDATYDAFLYGAGLPNRVTVSNVLSSSPADQAGVQSGDNILRYDGQRVYAASDLTSATTEGTANAPVRVDIEREGRELSVYIPRGPLGIRMTTTSVAPMSAGN